MFEMVKKFFNKLFFMSEEEYHKTLRHYIDKFELKKKWSFYVVDELPPTKTNYPNKEEVMAFTDLGSLSVVFKRKMFKQPSFLVRGYIRHEIRHCQQMEVIQQVLREKYGELASFYAAVVFTNDMIGGYNKSIMEQDAWMTFFGFHYNINKVVDRIIKRSLSFITE